MRVTPVTTFLTMRDDLNTALGQVDTYQRQLASGKRITQFSDAPSDAVTAMRLGAEQSNWAAWQRSADDATTWLSNADSTLQSVTQVIQRVNVLATNAVNGAVGPDSRQALAAEVTALRDQLVDLANSKVSGRALFGGFQDTAVAQVNGAWSYVGDGGAINRQVGPSATVQVNLPGDTVFGFAAGPGNDLFSTLDKLAADITSGNTTAIAADQNQLTARTQDVNAALGTLGALQNRVTAQQNLGKDTVNQLQKQQSDLEDIDVGQAVLQLQQARNAYTAALGAAGQANLPSLADFLH